MKAVLAVPITTLLVYRAWSKSTLTPAGIVAAIITAIIHAAHPWNLPFGLLVVFFMAGTRVTKIKQNIKSKLTISASGGKGGEGSRTHVQGVASVLTLLHTFQLFRRQSSITPQCLIWPGDLLYVGIVANYAAVAADTFSSELGIISKSQPRLITSLKLRKVPPGTNGGVTRSGLLAGILGSLIVVIATLVLTPFCRPLSLVKESKDQKYWAFADLLKFSLAMTSWGALGSVLDSLLGGWLQQSVVDTRSGKIIEAEGGKAVLVVKPDSRLKIRKTGEDVPSTCEFDKTAIKSIENQKLAALRIDGDSNINESITESYNLKTSRVIESGSLALLDNNQVNMAMALIMSLGAMGLASLIWNIPLNSLIP